MNKNKIKIGLITYDRPHLKTYQILKGLLKKYNVVLLVVKFVQIKKITFQFIDLINLKKKYHIKILKYKYEIFKQKDIKDLKYVLIGGAGLIDKKLF